MRNNTWVIIFISICWALTFIGGIWSIGKENVEYLATSYWLSYFFFAAMAITVYYRNRKG